MGCGCNNKTTPSLLSLEPDVKDPTIWGPILWRYLHSIAERMGYSSQADTTSQVRYFIDMLRYLPFILPCRICQEHAAEYIAAHPIPDTIMTQQQGETLRTTARQWLFDFHTAVRAQNNQSIMVATIEECQQLYQGTFLTNDEYSQFIQAVADAMRYQWIRLENWRKWYNYSENMRMLLGNIVQ